MGVIRNAEEEIRREPDEVHGRRGVGVSFIGKAKYAQALHNASLTIPIQTWSREEQGFVFFLKKPVSTPSLWFLG